MTEIWKGDLNCNMKVGAIFMDLSKAFDTLNHRLILAKLKTYALESNALSLIWVGGVNLPPLLPVGFPLITQKT